MSILQYSSIKKDNYTIISIGGSLDAETSPNFAKKIMSEIEKKPKGIICNLSKLDYIASAGLGVLIMANEELDKIDSVLRLSEMNEKVTKIFKLLGFINLFKVFSNDEEAVK